MQGVSARPLAHPLANLRRLELSGVGLALAALAVIVGALIQPVDFDYWWHVRTGQLIAETRFIPRTDPYSFTVYGEPWVNHEWLSQLIMFGVDSTLGYLALLLVFVGIGLTAWLLVYRFLRAEGMAPLKALAIALAPAVLGAMHWRARPAMFTVLLLTIFLVFLTRARTRDRKLWLLVPLMLLWANLHGGYVLGLFLIALFVFVQVAQPKDAGTPWKHAALVAVLAFAVTGISPHTYELWLYPFTYFVGENASMRLVDEWQSPDFHQLRNLPTALLLLSAVCVGANGRRFDLWQSLVLVLFAAAALQSLRHAPLFAIAWALVIGTVLVERWSWWSKESVASGSPAFNWGILLGGAAALFAVLTISPVGIPGRDAPTGGPLPYPVEAQAYLHEQGRSVRVYNEYSWGGYLINTGYPDLRVFVDGRADVYGELVNEYVRAQAGRDWETTFKRYDVEYALVRPGTPLIAELRAAGWIPLVDDDDQVLLGPPGTKFP